PITYLGSLAPPVQVNSVRQPDPPGGHGKNRTVAQRHDSRTIRDDGARISGKRPTSSSGITPESRLESVRLRPPSYVTEDARSAPTGTRRRRTSWQRSVEKP